MCGAILGIYSVVICNVLKQVPIYFSCLGESFDVVLLLLLVRVTECSATRCHLLLFSG